MMGKAVRADRVKLVCGGQTGVDRAMLDYCLARGLPCGGWCTGDRMAEDGPIDAGYPVEPIPGASYNDRTAANVRDSDATVIIFKTEMTGGTLKSFEFVQMMRRPYLMLDMSVMTPVMASRRMIRFLDQYKPGILNFSGPRASEWPEGYGYCYAILRLVYATSQ
jgi:hypothetical protein